MNSHLIFGYLDTELDTLLTPSELTLNKKEKQITK